jgi:hypothetical protein
MDTSALVVVFIVLWLSLHLTAGLNETELLSTESTSTTTEGPGQWILNGRRRPSIDRHLLDL